MIKHFLTKQFLVFLVVGGLAALLHWLSRILLSNWLSFSWAVIFAYVIGMLIAFVLNAYFVFPTSDKPRVKQARDFIVTNLAFFPVVWLAALTLNQLFRSFGMVNFVDAVSHGIAVGLPMFATFLIYKFFAFKDIKSER